MDVSSCGEALTRSWCRQILQAFFQSYDTGHKFSPGVWNEGCGWGMIIEELNLVQILVRFLVLSSGVR